MNWKMYVTSACFYLPRFLLLFLWLNNVHRVLKLNDNEIVTTVEWKTNEQTNHFPFASMYVTGASINLCNNQEFQSAIESINLVYRFARDADTTPTSQIIIVIFPAYTRDKNFSTKSKNVPIECTMHHLLLMLWFNDCPIFRICFLLFNLMDDLNWNTSLATFVSQIARTATVNSILWSLHFM